MEAPRKNVNRGYMRLRVWQDAVEYYRLTWLAFRDFPYKLGRAVSQLMVVLHHAPHREIRYTIVVLPKEPV